MGILWSKPASYNELKQGEKDLINEVEYLLIDNGFDWPLHKQQIDKWKMFELSFALIGSSQSGKSSFINSVKG